MIKYPYIIKPRTERGAHRLRDRREALPPGVFHCPQCGYRTTKEESVTPLGDPPGSPEAASAIPAEITTATAEDSSGEGSSAAPNQDSPPVAENSPMRVDPPTPEETGLEPGEERMTNAGAAEVEI